MEGYAFIPVSAGFAVGAAFVHLADSLIPGYAYTLIYILEEFRS